MGPMAPGASTQIEMSARPRRAVCERLAAISFILTASRGTVCLQDSARPQQHAGDKWPRPERARRLRRFVLALGALAVVTVLAGTALSLWRMHLNAIRQAERHMLDIAHILGEQTLRSTLAVGTVLTAAAEDAQRAEVRGRIVPSRSLHEHLRETLTAMPYIRELLLIDASGKLVTHTARYPAPPLNYAGSEYFRDLRARADLQLLVSPPVLERLGGAQSIPISRRISDQDGGFLGIITADVDPGFFVWPQKLNELGPDGVVRLLRSDGELLTGHPLALAGAIRNYRDTALFTQGVDIGQTLLHHVGRVNPVERISAIYPIPGYPMLISVTASTRFILQSWYRSAWLFGALAAVTAALIGLITLSLARQLRIDEALRAFVVESEERLQAVIQSAMDAIVIVDADGRIALFNAAAEQVFGRKSAQAIGETIQSIIPGYVLPLSQTGTEGEAHEPMQAIGRHVALDGERADRTAFPLDASISQVQLHGVTHFVFILRDVTERRKVEAALRENERRYRTLFSQAMDGILLLNTAGDIVDVNASFARMHGYSIEELMRMNLSHLDTAASLALAAARIRRILTGETIGFEVEHYHQDGRILPLDVAASAIDIDGQQYVLAFHRDITERKRAEQELKRSQQELRGLSKAANEALEAERRRTARELHDELGQSLTAMKMDLETLRSALAPGQDELQERARAMHVLLDSTIAATRRIASNLRPLMLDDLGLAAALDWLTQNYSKHTGIATDLVIDDEVAQVPDPIASALYRITQESLTNVAKYAQASAAEIRLERDGDWVQLLVRDNGRGIEPADQGKHGTFGLLGIRERVTLLGGTVAITGAPGRGSEVCARIPLNATEVAI